MAVTYKGKALLYTCAIVSTGLVILIVLNIFGIVTVPGSTSSERPIGAGPFEWKTFLTFSVFPVLTFLNLVLWAFTAVSGRMLGSRPGIRQALQLFYSLVTLALAGVLVVRML